MQTEEGRDKILGIEEYNHTIVVNYEKSGQLRKIEVPRDIVDNVKRIINKMEVGEMYTSKYICMKYIKENRIPSKIIESRMGIIEKKMEKNGIQQINRQWTIEDLKQDDDFYLMTYEELIGTRKLKDSLYFQLYGSIKYWVDKEQIIHNRRGGVFRVI